MQYTPKSHVNHLRKVAELEGNVQHYCIFRSDIPFHGSVAAVRGSVGAFIDWYCGEFRSSVGSNFTEQDCDTIRQQQAAMHAAVARGSLL